MCKFIINTKELLASFTKAKARLLPKTKICLVVKANAYGFGQDKVCTLFNRLADYFAVARLSEFLKVREVTNKPCLILSPLTNREMSIAIKSGAEITLSSQTDIDFLEKVASSNNTFAKVHLKLDTGMNRYGIKSCEELASTLEKLKEKKHIKVVGAFSHLYNADDETITKKQREKFIEMKNIILQHGFSPIFHLASSHGIKDKESQFDMVRLGFDLYFSQASKHKFVTYINEIKSVKEGETISYNGTFVAKSDMKIAVCAAGYADGVNRLLSNRGKVLIRGEEAKIVGNVCMDSFMADITDIEGAELGDEVVIFGKSGEKYISVCSVAQLCGTIPYEIYTNISLRVKRIYTWRNNASYSGKVWGKKTYKY